MTQTFIYHGIPKAQGRPRFSRRGKFVVTYDPKDSRQYKNNIAAQIVQQNPVLIGKNVPVMMHLLFVLPRPKNHYRANGEVKERCLHIKHTGRPDLDNMEKALKDALKGIVWHDDSQVFSVVKSKIYGEKPKVEITVTSEEK